MNKPIKRVEALKPLSRDHHHGLMLCWKIREGLKRKVSADRIKDYLDWFWKHHLTPHFHEEEKYVFPVLGEDNELVKQALEEHRELGELFTGRSASIESLNRIEKKLEAHIRFEERVLFNKIQDVASEQQLHSIALHHNQPDSQEEWKDVFWL